MRLAAAVAVEPAAAVADRLAGVLPVGDIAVALAAGIVAADTAAEADRLAVVAAAMVRR